MSVHTDCNKKPKPFRGKLYRAEPLGLFVFMIDFRDKRLHKTLIINELKKKGAFYKGIRMTELAKVHANLYGYDINKWKIKLGILTNKRAKRYFKAVFNARRKSFEGKPDETEYQKYLKSDKWKMIRADIIAERVGCERCGSKDNLQVHHLTYKNIFNELPTDLELLCSGCHYKEHFK